jgi:xylose isomerase
VRRQSLDPEDLILGHAGAMDTCARALKAAAALLEDGSLEAARNARYAGWDKPEGAALLSTDLASIYDSVVASGINPQPVSGRQERLENLWNRFV